jgi:plastocyanin
MAMTRRRFGMVCAAALVALVGAGPAARPSHGAAATRVRWVNDDEDAHTVASATGAFASPGLDRGEAFAHTFTVPGTYAYFCALHPGMTGTITVR